MADERELTSTVTFVEGVNRYATDYIKFADAKAGVLLSIATALGAALGVVGPTVLTTARSVHFVLFAGGLLASAVTALAGVMTLVACANALSPRTACADKSLASFTDIAGMSPAEYTAALSALTPTQISHHYASHNVALSRIALAKFDALTTAVRWLRIGLVSAYLTALTHAFATASVASRADVTNTVQQGCYGKSAR